MATISVEFTQQEMNAEMHKVFNRDSFNWSPQSEYNLIFLKANQQYCNDLLASQGHVFLNEVLDALGLPRTSLGAVLGWTKNRPIDFGIDPVSMNDEISLHFKDLSIIVNDV